MALSALSRYDTQRVSSLITKSAHGFIVGDVLRFDGANWVKAIATASSTFGYGVVVKVISSSIFELGLRGFFTFAASHGLTIGTQYYLSTSSGVLTSTAPTFIQKVLVPLSATEVLIDIDDLDTASVPAGGATGDILIKSSGSDYAVAWTDAPTVDKLSFDTAAAETAGAGQLVWNTADGTLDLGMAGGNTVQQMGLEVYYRVKNQTGSTIPNGSVVKAVGTTGNSGRVLIARGTADHADEPEYIMGLTTESIANGTDGYVTYFGFVRGLNTTGSAVSETWVDGDVLYVHPTTAGALTKVPPTAPDHKIVIALVIHAHSHGTLLVRTSNGFHLEDLHDVYINSIADGQLLSWDNTNGRWKNTSNLTITGSALTSTVPIVLPADPTNPLEAVTLQYLQNYFRGWDWKPSVRVSSASNVVLASELENGDVLNGVTLATNDRVLLTGQTAPEENGVWVVPISGAATRATDMDSWLEIPGAVVVVEQGTANADTVWICTANQGGTLGTTAITFTQIPTGAGLTGTFTAGQISYATGTTTLAGSNNFFFNSSNNQLGVGVNTFPNTIDKLYLYTSSNVPIQMRIGNITTGSTDTDGLILGMLADGSAYLWNYENKPLYFGANNLEALRIDASSNTLFGGAEGKWTYYRTSGRLSYQQSSPVNPLHIHNTGSGDPAELRFTNPTTGATASDGFIVGINADGSSYLWNYENAYFQIGTNNTSRMRILAGGNVGFGTDAPNYPLHLHAASANNRLQITNTTTGTTTGDGLTLGMSGTYGFLSNAEADVLAFYTSALERWYIDASGNLIASAAANKIGMGITSSLQGNIHIHDTAASLRFSNATTGSGASQGTSVGIGSGGDFQIYNFNNNHLLFASNNTYRAVLNKSGNLNIGNLANDNTYINQTSHQVLILNNLASQEVLRLRGIASQSGDYFDIVNSSDVSQFRVDSLGDVYIENNRSLILRDADSSNHVALKSPAVLASNVSFTLPGADGTNGQAITTNASGQLGFTSFLPLAGGTLTGALTLNADPANALEPVTLQYLQNYIRAWDWKDSVKVSSSTNVVIATALENGDTLNGVTLATNDRVFLRGQTLPEENGIYVVPASGAATRALDMDSWTEIPGAVVIVEQGTADADTVWICTANQGGTLGTTAITFTQIPTGAGLTFNSSTSTLTATAFSGSLSGNVTGDVTGNVSGNAGTVTTADEATDTSCFLLFSTAASGSLAPKTNSALAFNSNTGMLTLDDATVNTLLFSAAEGGGSVVEQKLSTTTAIDGTATGTTNLYIVPSGKTAIITRAVVRVTAADAITVAGAAGIGIAAGESDIFNSTVFTGLNSTGKGYMLSNVMGTFATGAAASVIKLGVDTAFTATTATLAVDLFGYLV